tara:strand:+ start:898 stop:1359 length:462 start_codon:yes stop_codon:yes gene_type:complete
LPSHQITPGQEFSSNSFEIMCGNSNQPERIRELLKDLAKAKNETDPWYPDLMRDYVRTLDDAGLYGDDIIRLHRDVCYSDIYLTSACLRAATINGIALQPEDLREAVQIEPTFNPITVIADVQKYIPGYAKGTRHDHYVPVKGIPKPAPQIQG